MFVTNLLSHSLSDVSCWLADGATKTELSDGRESQSGSTVREGQAAMALSASSASDELLES